MPDLPLDVIFDKILPLMLLPTKAEFQVSFLTKQYWDKGLKPVLDFDEYDDFNRRNRINRSDFIEGLIQHTKFINFLGGYLKLFYQNPEFLLIKLRLRMMMYKFREQDAEIITRWLKCASERGVIALDISFGDCSTDEPKFFNAVTMYRLPWLSTFSNAKFLTCMNLGGIEINDVVRSGDIQSNVPLLPSLKILTFTTVRFHGRSALLHLVLECPSVEYVSLTASSSEDGVFFIISRSIKCFEVKYCDGIKCLSVNEAENLECYTYVSLPPPKSSLECMILAGCTNLKTISIHVDDFRVLNILRYRRELMAATIITPTVHLYEFNGLFTAVLYVGDHPQTSIHVGEIIDDEGENSLGLYLSGSTRSPRLGCLDDVFHFLLGYSYCHELALYFRRDFKLLIFPEALRKTMPAPALPQSCFLVVRLQNPPKVGTEDYLDLMDSLHWIAPSALIVVLPENEAL